MKSSIGSISASTFVCIRYMISNGGNKNMAAAAAAFTGATLLIADVLLNGCQDLRFMLGARVRVCVCFV